MPFVTASNTSNTQKPGKAGGFGGQSLNQSKALVKFKKVKKGNV